MRHPSLALLALGLLALGLAACGGGDSSTDTASSASPGQTSSSAAQKSGGEEKGLDKAAGGEKSKGPASSEEAEEGTGASTPKAGRPASLKTDPAAIRGAIVTSKGAVQTAPPSTAAQEKAMENSYSSIKAFGEESEGAEATDITFALVQYLTAKANGDWATACARIYTPLRENIAKLAEKSQGSVQGGGCPAAYGALMEKVPKSESAEAAKIDVASVRRGDGNRAFVIYKTPNTLSADMPMYLDGDVWTVGAIEAYVLTPEELAENQG